MMRPIAMYLATVRTFHACTVMNSGGLFRANLPVNNNEWGPLTDLPDFTLLDRPSPRFTSEGQRRRAIRNYEATTSIMRLTAELSRTKAKSENDKVQQEMLTRKAEQSCLRSKGTFAQSFEHIKSDLCGREQST
ncbi:unnamed protein product [Dicrocoelium dendriticum]|nr:unnamed protein product [Dicrocoelium dendriticum]